MKAFLSLVTLACVAFILHFAWEWLHLPLYTGYANSSGGMPITLYATLGDVAYTLGAALLVALFKHKVDWIRHAHPADYAGLGVLGFFLALLVEYKGLLLHRWAYTAAMPIFLGVGVSPLLQMTLLLPCSIFFTKHLWTRHSHS